MADQAPVSERLQRRPYRVPADAEHVAQVGLAEGGPARHRPVEHLLLQGRDERVAGGNAVERDYGASLG
jgi:hypothetical protein